MKAFLKKVALRLPLAIFCVAIALSSNFVNAQAATDSKQAVDTVSAAANGTEAMQAESGVQGGTYQRGDKVWALVHSGGQYRWGPGIVASGPSGTGYYRVYLLPYRINDPWFPFLPSQLKPRN
jgi:hypothetical protein